MYTYFVIIRNRPWKNVWLAESRFTMLYNIYVIAIIKQFGAITSGGDKSAWHLKTKISLSAKKQDFKEDYTQRVWNIIHIFIKSGTFAGMVTNRCHDNG